MHCYIEISGGFIPPVMIVLKAVSNNHRHVIYSLTEIAVIFNNLLLPKDAASKITDIFMQAVDPLILECGRGGHLTNLYMVQCLPRISRVR